MLTFYIYDPDDDDGDFLPSTAMTLKEYLQNPPSWKPQIENTILTFSGLPMLINDDINNFGILPHILSQLEEVKKRLLEDQFALLKTSNYNESLFFIFEPKEDNTYFSLLGLLPSPYSAYYPISDSPFYFKDIDQQKELYTFIETTTEFNWADNLIGNLQKIKNIEYNTAQLVSSIEEQVTLGNELIEFLR
ncbi:hypothetical protein [Flavobacterium poyangense]|uniref:hypothetical protein n=1 Tax=Flavobacterium poyangense TaxID=2204302 RepID=UPI001422B5D7|nr:hypothetical protein [Flavobacterium sp. JXAS1]